MKKLLLALVGLAVIAIVTLLILDRRPHPPETTPQAATLLPSSTLAFVDIPDFQSCRAKVAASPLAPFWQNPEVQACFGKPFTDWTGVATSGQPPTWLTTLLGGDAIQMPHGEAFLAITHMAISPDRAPQFTFAAGINLPDRTFAMQTALKLLAYKLSSPTPAPQSQPKPTSIANTPSVNWRPTHRFATLFSGPCSSSPRMKKYSVT